MLYLHRQSVDGELDPMFHAIEETISHPVSQKVKQKLTVNELFCQRLSEINNMTVNSDRIIDLIIINNYVNN